MNKIKNSFVALGTAMLSSIGILFIPLILLLLSNILDYATGLMASPSRGQEIDSYKGITGIKKKVSMWILVVVGAMVDILIMYATDFTTLDIKFTFVFATVTALWLVCNESISTLENLNDMGVNLPPFLLPLLNNLKNQTEEKATSELPNTERTNKNND